MEIRQFVIGDSAAAVELWSSTGLLWPSNDPVRDIERKLEDSPWGFLVMVEDDDIIGSIMVGYDGHRGWVNYLACHTLHRRRGVATSLMTEAASATWRKKSAHWAFDSWTTSSGSKRSRVRERLPRALQQVQGSSVRSNHQPHDATWIVFTMGIGSGS